jgi:hypothetical protein
MLKRLTLVLLVYLCVSTAAEARERYFNYCQRGGQKVVTQGLQSAGTYQRTFQSCMLHVYLAGTTTLATLYSDNLTPASTPLANPFTAASDGFFFFYAAAGRYDVQETFLDGTVSPPVTIQLTWGDVLLCDPIGPNADSTCTLPPPEACTSVQVSGVEAGCEHEINFIPGTNITSITAVDNPGNTSNDVTINASGTPGPPGPAASCDPTKNVIYHVSTAGSDVTGDGTIGNPWATIQHAIDQVPTFVDGKYYVQLDVAGEYSGPNTIADRVFPGAGINYEGCGVNSPCSQIYIIGDVDAPETYLLDTSAADAWASGSRVVSVDGGASVTLRGVTLQKTGFGAYVDGGSQLTLCSVKCLNDGVCLFVSDPSVIFLDPTCVTPDGYSAETTAAGLVGGVPITMHSGYDATNQGLITDICNDGSKEGATNSYLFCETGGGGMSYGCLSMWGARAELSHGVIANNLAPIFEEGSFIHIQYITHDTATHYDPTITAYGGIVSGDNWVNANYKVIDSSAPGTHIPDLTKDYAIFGGTAIISLPHYVDGGFNNVYFPAYGTNAWGDALTSGKVTNPTETLVPVTAAANTVLNFSAGRYFYISVGAQIDGITATGIDTTNLSDGQTTSLIFCQDVGGHAVTFGALWLGAGAVDVNPNKCSSQSFVYRFSTAKFYAVGAMTTW